MSEWLTAHLHFSTLSFLKRGNKKKSLEKLWLDAFKIEDKSAPSRAASTRTCPPSVHSSRYTLFQSRVSGRFLKTCGILWFVVRTISSAKAGPDHALRFGEVSVSGGSSYSDFAITARTGWRRRCYTTDFGLPKMFVKLLSQAALDHFTLDLEQDKETRNKTVLAKGRKSRHHTKRLSRSTNSCRHVGRYCSSSSKFRYAAIW